MNINLYYPNNQDNASLITFTMPNGLISINVFVFNFIINSGNNNDNGILTKLVSGYEKNYRKIDMCIHTLSDEQNQKKIDGYVVSCIRMPFIANKFITLPDFSMPLSIVIVQIYNETQVWHVFGVRKHYEPKTFQRVGGVYVCENGNEVFYKKELIAVRGNVPASFVAALSKHVNNINDLDIVTITHPNIVHNKENVTLILH
ncbi:ac146 [Artaxa digramma nucleopolyhedrovirus]|uniref:Ac146 n=1 Tax=Artaxa digramma nucleopolyhedrovirus TaxID=3070910 RepID=A0AAE6UZH9_9ABAC|nr:ac146 [Euproctis digramma nucleopolyhedrovirus]QHB21668.1 ac146 [Artaxa digramma nucleopolyhedrovirus]